MRISGLPVVEVVKRGSSGVGLEIMSIGVVGLTE